jgi:hypothetical protein
VKTRERENEKESENETERVNTRKRMDPKHYMKAQKEAGCMPQCLSLKMGPYLNHWAHSSRRNSPNLLLFYKANYHICVTDCSAVLPISFFVTRFDVSNSYFIVQYQEGSKLPICIDTVHLKLYYQSLNQFWEL